MPSGPEPPKTRTATQKYDRAADQFGHYSYPRHEMWLTSAGWRPVARMVVWEAGTN